MLTVGSLTLAAGSLLDYDLAPGAGDRVVVTGTLTANGGKFHLAGSGLATATHVLIDYSGALGGSFSNFSLVRGPMGSAANWCTTWRIPPSS